MPRQTANRGFVLASGKIAFGRLTADCERHRAYYFDSGTTAMTSHLAAEAEARRHRESCFDTATNAMALYLAAEAEAACLVRISGGNSPLISLLPGHQNNEKSS